MESRLGVSSRSFLATTIRMNAKVFGIFLVSLFPAIPLLRGQAVATSQMSPAPSSLEQQIQEVKNPFSWMSWGGDFRVRNEYLNNSLTLNEDNPLHEQDY